MSDALNCRGARGMEEGVVGKLLAPLELHVPLPKLRVRDGDEIQFGSAAPFFPGVELARDASRMEVVKDGAESP